MSLTEFTRLPPFVINDLVVDVIATRFEVSTEVIQRRLGYDQLDLKAMWV